MKGVVKSGVSDIENVVDDVASVASKAINNPSTLLKGVAGGLLGVDLADQEIPVLGVITDTASLALGLGATLYSLIPKKEQTPQLPELPKIPEISFMDLANSFSNPFLIFTASTDLLVPIGILSKES